MTVDDSASIRQTVSFTLQQAGYQVMEANETAGMRRQSSGGSPFKPEQLPALVKKVLG